MLYNIMRRENSESDSTKSEKYLSLKVMDPVHSVVAFAVSVTTTIFVNSDIRNCYYFRTPPSTWNNNNLRFEN